MSVDGTLSTRFGAGLGYIPKAVSWIFSTHRRLLAYVVLPALVNILLFALLFVILRSYGGDLVEALEGLMAGDHPWYLAWLVMLARALLWLVVVVVVAVVAFFTVYFLGNVIAAPFNDLLSAKVEAIRLGLEEEPFSLSAFMADIGFTVKEELKRLGFFLLISMGLILLNVIPLVGSAAHFVIGGWLMLLFFALEYLDLPMARGRRHPFSQRWKVVRRNLVICTGFGTSTALLLGIPLLNFLCIPLAVVGGTLMYADLKEAGRLLH